jgi:hypothetical protein
MTPTQLVLLGLLAVIVPLIVIGFLAFSPARWWNDGDE